MSPRALFRTFAITELFTWTGLITALILRATGAVNLVPIAGGIHGFVFLCYVVTTIFVWGNQQWRFRVGATGVALAIVPFATFPFELWVDHRRMLQGTWRLAPGGDTPRGFVEHVQAWILKHPALSLVGIVLLLSAVFVTLLTLGPPIPRS